MANFKGAGSLQKHNLIVTTFPNGVTKNKEGKVTNQFADVQVNMADPRYEGETNPHLITKYKKNHEGVTKPEYGAAYAVDQFAGIVEAAGDNFVVNANGSTTYGLEADVVPAKSGNGMAIKTNSEMKSSAIKLEEGVVNRNYEAGAANREAVKEAKEAAKAAGEPVVVADPSVAVPEAESGEAAALEGAEEPSLA